MIGSSRWLPGLILTIFFTRLSALSAEEIRRTAEKGPVRLTVQVTPSEPKLSDLVQMTVEVQSPEQVDVKAPAFGDAVGDFLIREYSEDPPQTDENGQTTRRFRYQLEPTFSGVHLIRSVSVEFADKRDTSEAKGRSAYVESDPIEVKVISEFGDELPNLANLEPMLPPQPVDDRLSAWWSLLLLLLIPAFFLFRRRQTRQRPGPAEKVLTPEEIAHAALARLLAENLPAQGLSKEFYVRLTGIVRVFIEGTTGLRAPEQTTEEFLRAVRSQDVFPPDRTVRLTEFLEAADMVKYAGLQPGNEQIDLATLRASEFIRMHTLPQNPRVESGQPV